MKELIERFKNNIEDYKSSRYDEENTKIDFIDKFFALLGWDVYNNSGASEDFREVVREDKVIIKGRPKSPDYSFKIGKERQFFVEAKKPSINIYEDIKPAFQVRRYGYTAGLPISVLTDFEEFAIYDTSIKPNENDKASVARIFYCKFDEYEKYWEFFNDTISKQAVWQGKLKKYVSGNKKKKGTQSVDRELLKLIETWREGLAKNIALRNKDLDIYQLNEAVQKIIDRIIFLRMAEDRNTEVYATLQGIAEQKDIYQILVKFFDSANKKYNSGLFKTQEWLGKLTIDDKIFKTIISDIYYPMPYEFSVLPIEILGHIYEQFLGKTIRLTAGHQAKIEEKPEVRKAGGVYYTPKYIVDYIVENTVGKKIEKKTPKQISTLTVLDPACGSGSFLVGAYNFLLNYHLDYWTDSKNLKKGLQEEHIYQKGEKIFALTLKEKRQILLNNIYGVDIDSQAVEVTKLSLLLTLMEGEIIEASTKLFLKTSKEAILPNLENNIKCGNSLIGTDFYNDKELQLFDTHEQRKINCFDWEDEFKSIFEAGGFDCVIGNPPYGAELNAIEKQYLEHKYQLHNTDTAVLFMGLSLYLMKKNGVNSYIIPKSFVFASNWKYIQKPILIGLKEIVDCGKVWKQVKLEQIIYLYSNEKKQDLYQSCVRNEDKIERIGVINKETYNEFGFILNSISDKELSTGLRIKNVGTFLNDFVINKQGIPNQKYTQDEVTDYKVIGGAEIKKYIYNRKIKGYISKKYIDNNCAFIQENSIFVQRIVAHVENPVPHIKIIATIFDDINTNEYIIVNTIIQLLNNNKYSKKFILGLLNSHLVSWYSYRFIYGKAIRTMQFYNPTTSRIPIPNLDMNNPPEKAQHDKLVSLVEQMLSTQKEAHSEKIQTETDKKFFAQRIKILDKQIDTLVYELYDLSEAEISVVEGRV